MTVVTQPAIQFVGGEQVVFNPAKPLAELGPHDIRLRVDACGLCFSDTKLLHAFTSHPRKSAVVRVEADAIGASQGGFDPNQPPAERLAALAASPQYVPGEAPVVPGHEVTGHIVAIGSAVTGHEVGQRVLVQTDYRHLPTPGSNAALGYTFDGGLQPYLTVDERVVIDPATGDHFLIPVGDQPTNSAVALCEPWACVEAAYAWGERQAIKPGSTVLVVAETGRTDPGLAGLLAAAGPGRVDLLADAVDLAGLPNLCRIEDIGSGPYDDIVYLGSDADKLERLAELLGFGGLLVFALGGGRLARPVQIDVGRVHYDLIRLAGTTGESVAQAYASIPALTEIRPGNKVAIIGSAGPMGLMHTMRAAVAGVPGVSIVAADVDDARLAHLAALVAPVAAAHGVPLACQNSANEPLAGGFDYISVMVPSPGLVAQAINLAGPGAIVNAFAGFAVGTMAALDLEAMAERGIYLMGTSGSRIRDMRAILAKVESGVLDTNVSLDAVCGLAGVPDALAAIANRTSTGKIMVYPSLTDFGLVRLVDLATVRPDVAALMDGPRWTSAAEAALLHR